MLKLYIGNKNYSSWSMRPWVLLKQSAIAFDEVMLRFDGFGPTSNFKQTLRQLAPTAKVPVLQDDTLLIWDSLAIAEYLAEQFPQKKLWPLDARARARARSVCAEMHSGFHALRAACPLNIEANLAPAGALIWRDQSAVRLDTARLISMWQELLQSYSGPLLFGDFSVADAYFAPVVMRLCSYALPVPDDISAYLARVRALPGVQAWCQAARDEHDFLDFEEPYRLHA